MKKLITLSILLCILIGCKEKPKKAQPEVGTLPASTVTKKVDTTINQEVWYKDGKYYLQTYVVTELGQEHLKEEPRFVYGGEKFCPYNTQIAGSFNYIAEHKQSEYTKAHKYIYETNDSVNALKAIKIKK